MSAESKDFAVWFYRSFIGVMMTLTFLFVKSNYDEFQDMKRDVSDDKVKHAVIDSRFIGIDNRLTFIEAKVK